MPFSISCQSCWRDRPGAQVGPVLPGVRTRTQSRAAPIPAQHRTGGQEQRRQIHRRGTHQQTRRGLVAPTHQHRAVDRVGPQQLLGLHRQQVAVQHRRRLLERLRQRHRRHLHREPARLPDAALHLLHALLEVRVARVDVTPRVDDRDHRLAPVVGAVVAHLRGAGPMPERAHVRRPVPPVTAEFFRLLAGHDVHLSTLRAQRPATGGSSRRPRRPSARRDLDGSRSCRSPCPCSHPTADPRPRAGCRRVELGALERREPDQIARAAGHHGRLGDRLAVLGADRRAIRAVCSSASSAAATGSHPLDHVNHQRVPQVGHQHTDGLGPDIVDDDAARRSSPAGFATRPQPRNPETTIIGRHSTGTPATEKCLLDPADRAFDKRRPTRQRGTFCDQGPSS